MFDSDALPGDWKNAEHIAKRSYMCAYCSREVGPNRGYSCIEQHKGPRAHILVCPTCNRPTFITVGGQQVPGAPFGDRIPDITDKVLHSLYQEARSCASVGAFTSCVMACRKILMNAAVHQGAEEALSFLKYVDFLETKNFIPPTGRPWVDAIRKLGNTATHEIKLMSKEDAELAVRFTEMLLRFIYEMPAILSRSAKSKP